MNPEVNVWQRCLDKLDEVKDNIDTLSDFDNGWAEFINETHDEAKLVVLSLRVVVESHRPRSYGMNSTELFCSNCSKGTFVSFPCNFINNMAKSLNVVAPDLATLKLLYPKGIPGSKLTPAIKQEIEDAVILDGCTCYSCKDDRSKTSTITLCPTCRYKRCPRATHHKYACSRSNEPGQPGSRYTNAEMM